MVVVAVVLRSTTKYDHHRVSDGRQSNGTVSTARSPVWSGILGDISWETKSRDRYPQRWKNENRWRERDVCNVNLDISNVTAVCVLLSMKLSRHGGSVPDHKTILRKKSRHFWRISVIFFPSFSVPNGQSMLGSFRSILAKTPKKSKEWQSDQREIHKARYANVFSSFKFPFYTHKREGLK